MWARLELGKIVELTDIDPAGRFHPDLVWVPCADDAKIGATISTAAEITAKMAANARLAIQSQIDALEQAQLLPRVTREGLLAAAVALAATQGVDEPSLYTANITYHKLKDFDAQIGILRAQLDAIA